VVVPSEVFERHSADAVRYWGGIARLGVDAAFDERQMKVGRRLAIKILNASRFALSIESAPRGVVEPLDRSMAASLADVVREATTALDGYDHAKALEATERFFWSFTDDYLELVKQRAYGGDGDGAAGSAVGALHLALDVMLRLFAPFLPYVTEEVWSWWKEGSVHRAAWPEVEELAGTAGESGVYAVAADVLTAVRKAKALQKVSLRAQAERVTVRDTPERLALLERAERDLRNAGNIASLETVAGDGFDVETVLAELAAS